ncbi:MAG TPA: hypothetical protein VLQ91_16835, partial [Draconibacterium sp.]|nr:hypothetical protein [Draconibacterium sp.]
MNQFNRNIIAICSPNKTFPLWGNKKGAFILSLLVCILIFSGCNSQSSKTPDFFDYANSRNSDLQLGVYITAHTVQEQFSTEAGCREAISVLQCNGFSKVYVEVYRPGMVVPTEILKKTVSLLENNGFEVVGGIATLPGEGVGVTQEGPLTWFNWQNPK